MSALVATSFPIGGVFATRDTRCARAARAAQGTRDVRRQDCVVRRCRNTQDGLHCMRKRGAKPLIALASLFHLTYTTDEAPV